MYTFNYISMSYKTIYLFFIVILFHKESEQKIGASIPVGNDYTFKQKNTIPKSYIGNEISDFHITDEISQ